MFVVWVTNVILNMAKSVSCENEVISVVTGERGAASNGAWRALWSLEVTNVVTGGRFPALKRSPCGDQAKMVFEKCVCTRVLSSRSPMW